ncbi:hypothetical protein A2334_01355 [Candidatus Roizmanbacteria bacterium RIFOXYB2_FULL_38_10]|uniref:ComEC/Rec2-related protein domain-containing protein n=1 Tax=Candidatus Roizmanbacteria bacterium RIFOXYD1_FULL_38_12 TaxID=1802093 RepID=A0A1F7L1P4_9BACT|nr:MAG: hypothetical protein A3K47_04650 [Candidatus Roizmanbacteria bacterium RIFOXYA2_FULL_38_14]OGK64040.1 MAG: hypothetical protein A3K27_04650 [Candidatus Roizmanbacteria bacterium RIFOXYA1_FULL_37_12]OGK65886.1 MAG: hypothetical protein A3K38_04650 [Candidatus Roizmanbacteria bacterium RIFOXYB1_FULL_40_23]OGK68992.1 MAG: hypothetical protein A2334_01355 [Candidatus Roizmanbacteria bacterium RIFOXYB2_FULL_38_10]OGK70291.1 MAG: hypothetical protein A3K21_04655 [Candidatus Roizmanbacteria ba
MNITPSIFTSVINSYLPEPHASLLNGILFGIPLRSTKILYQQLQVVGLLHLVVLSGMNITILGAIVGLATNKLPKNLSLFCTIGCIVAFSFFVGPQPPIVRAAVMGTLSTISIIYGKRNTALVSLLCAVLVIAIFKKDWLSGISCQLSVGATFGIILFGKGRGGNAVIQDLRTSLAAQIFTAPLIFIFFKQISLISPLSNLAVSFLIPPLMIFGFLTAILGNIHWLLGLPLSYICYGLLSYMIFAIKILSKVPFAFVQF